MRKLQGAIAAAALATAALAAPAVATSPAIAAAVPVTAAHGHPAGPDSIIGDITQARFGDGQPGIALDAAALPGRADCSYTIASARGSTGYAGNVTVHISYMSGCASWQAKVQCQNSNGSLVWRYSRSVFGPATLTAGCYSDQYAQQGGWTGFWNGKYHQVFS